MKDYEISPNNHLKKINMSVSRKWPTSSPCTRITLREHHLKVKCSTSHFPLNCRGLLGGFVSGGALLDRVNPLLCMWGGAVNRQPGYRARNLQRRGFREGRTLPEARDSWRNQVPMIFDVSGKFEKIMIFPSPYVDRSPR